jgi:serine/threonine protein kinase
VESWLAASDGARPSLDAPVVKFCKSCDVTYSGETKFCHQCGEPLQDDPRALIGTKLDNLYVIERLLGMGGMGAVYEARHALLGDRVAVKTLKRELSERPQFLKRFQREGRAARSFHHPNAVTVYDLRMTPSGLVYMVLEYIQGTNVRGLLRSRGRLSISDALEILVPLASVLDVAHEAGIVHRDLKPENVMLADGGVGADRVKLLDLGIAKLLESATHAPTTELTAVDQVLGTPPYMSPEQWGMPQKDGGTEVDRRADVYSLAVMAFEMVTGAWPYPGPSIDDLRAQHTGSPVPSARAFFPGVPEPFARVLAHGMAKDRTERPPTAGVLVSSLVIASRASGTYGRGTKVAGGTRDRGASPAETALFNVTETSADLTPAGKPSIGGLTQTATSRAIDESNVQPERRSRRGRLGRSTLRLGAAAALVAAVLVAGYALLRHASQPDPTSVGASASATSPAAAAPSPAASSSEIVRYWVEARSVNGDVARVTGTDPLPNSNGFRFHFVAQKSGYYYVLGPNEREVLTLFYSTSPTVPVAKGEEVVVPRGGWATPTPGSTIDRITVVFSPARLGDAGYLSARLPHPLTSDELRRFEAFRHASVVDTLNVRAAQGETSMQVLTPTLDKPVTFDVTIAHGR